MTDRLRAEDLAIMAQDSVRTPMHNLSVEIFDPRESGLDYEGLLAHICDRLSYVPRYRQRIREVPGRLANPIWVDDPHFDLAYHVRRSAVPSPGKLEQVRELAARIASRPLDPQRPLWEVYFVEGLEGGRVALLSKSHEVLVDGISTVDLGQVLLDIDPEPHTPVQDEWQPAEEPAPARLVAVALAEGARSPSLLVGAARGLVGFAASAGGTVASRVVDAASALTGRRSGLDSPFNLEPSGQRRLIAVRTKLGDYRKVRRAHGGTVNDVIIATLTAAIRSWLMTRAEEVSASRKIRALVPLAVVDEDLEPTSVGAQVVGHIIDLPIGEASPVVRLHQVSYAMRSHREGGKAVAADDIAGVSGFAPATFHALGSRLAATNQSPINLVITNVPGPQFPLFLAGAQMVETFPAPPLPPGFGLAIGVTSYDGGVYYGITADRDAFPDADVLGQCVVEALEELVESARADRPRAPRGRRTQQKTE